MANTIGTVKTKYGLVTGVELTGKYEGITLFKGIPYAAPPVGDLRWRAPRDPKPWDGVRSCDSYAPICFQPTNGDLDAEPWHTDFYYMGTPPMSEDCLYLNVCTGAKEAGDKRPVFVWFHGGGSDHGYSYEAEFDPSELAKKGVVVVSVAQRLSMFGYLALPQLSEEQGGKSGNYILMDDMKALQWIIENIDAFGGDPDCITVGGQSAGTGKSSSLAFTELAKGHVKRVINESGLAWRRNNSTLKEMEEACAAYLREIGIDPTLPMEELRKMEPSRFLPSKRGVRIPGGLVCDGDLVPFVEIPRAMEKYGGDYDYLAGTNLGETHMKPNTLRGQEGFRNPREFYTYAKEILGDLYDEYDFEHLVPVTVENVDRVSRRLASYGLFVDRARMGGLALNMAFGQMRLKTAPGKKTYNYLFSRVAPHLESDRNTDRDPDRLMSWHSNELWYSFASLREGTPPARPWEERDFALADEMSSYWANFIKTGNPNGEGLPYWPNSGEEESIMELGDECYAIPANDRLWEMITKFLDRHHIIPEEAKR